VGFGNGNRTASGFNKATGTSLATSAAYGKTPVAGDRIFCLVASDNLSTSYIPQAQSLTKPAGEGNNWVILGENLPNQSSGNGVCTRVFSIIPTPGLAAWSSHIITTAYSQTVTGRVMIVNTVNVTGTGASVGYIWDEQTYTSTGSMTPPGWTDATTHPYIQVMVAVENIALVAGTNTPTVTGSSGALAGSTIGIGTTGSSAGSNIACWAATFQSGTGVVNQNFAGDASIHQIPLYELAPAQTFSANGTVAATTTVVGGAWPTGSPPTLANAMTGWWDTSDAATLTQSGGRATSLGDKSGNGFTLNVVHNDGPFTDSTINGLQALRGDGVSGLRTGAGVTAVVQPHTVWGVVLSTDNTFTRVFVGHDRSNIRVVSGFWGIDAAAAVMSSSAPTGGTEIIVGHFNGATSTFWINGQQVASGSIGDGTHAIQRFGILHNAYNQGEGAVGLIGETGVHVGLLSNADRQKLQTYLGTKWGVTIPVYHDAAGAIPATSTVVGSVSLKAAPTGTIPVVSTVVGTVTERSLASGTSPATTALIGSPAGVKVGTAGLAVAAVSTVVGAATFVPGVVTHVAAGTIPLVSTHTGTVTARVLVPSGAGGSAPPTHVGWFTSATWSTAGGATTRTATYSGQAGDRIAVILAAENADLTVLSITNDGAALTWASQELYDANAANRVLVGIWTSTLDTARTIVVTATKNGPTMEWGVGLSVWRDSDGFGAAEQANSGTTDAAPALTIVTQPKSAVVGVNADWNATAGARTYRNPYPSTAVEDLYGGTIGAQYATEVFRYNDTDTGGSDVIGLTAPAAQRHGIAAIEVLGATTAGGGTPINAVSGVSGAVSKVVPAAAGIVAVLSTVVGDVSARIPASGTIAAVSAVSAAEVALHYPTGTIALTTTVTGAATKVTPVAGNPAAAISALVAAEYAEHYITGLIAIVSGNPIADAVKLQPATGTVALAPTISGDIDAILLATGNPVVATTTASGNATIVPGSLNYAAAGTVVATSTATDAAIALHYPSGTVAVISTAAGSSTPLDPANGTIPLISTAVGTVTALLPTSGTSPSSTTVSGAATKVVPGAEGSVAGTSTAAGTVTARLAAASTAAAVTTVSGAASRLAETITGLVTGVSGSSGTVSLRGFPTGSISVLSTVAGAAAGIKVGTSSAAAATSTVAGSVAPVQSVAATVAGTSTVSGSATVVSGPVIRQVDGVVALAVVVLGSIDRGVWVVSGQVECLSTAAGSSSTLDPANGTCSIVSGAVGTVTARLPSFGAIPLSSTVSGAVAKVVPGAVGTVGGTSAAPGAITALLLASGTAAGSTTLAGAVSKVVPGATGTVPAISGVTEAVVAIHLPTGLVVGVSTTVGSVSRVAAPIAGAVAATSTVVGSVNSVNSATGSVAGSSTTTGTPIGLHYVTGSADSVSACIGNASISGTQSGQVNATTSTAGTVTARFAPTGTVPAVTVVGTTPTVRAYPTGICSSTSTVAGAIVKVSPAASGVAGTSTVSGSATVVLATFTLQAGGTIPATSSGTGNVTARLYLAGTSGGTSTTSGAVRMVGYPSGSVTATSTFVGQPTARLPLTGSTGGSTTLGGQSALIAQLVSIANAVSTLNGSVTLRTPPTTDGLQNVARTGNLQIRMPDGQWVTPPPVAMH
jgi:hypothetical protein